LSNFLLLFLGCLHSGRLDKLLYVPLPTPGDRSSILQALAGKIRLGEDVHLDAIGRSSRADGYSGADCAALIREAGLAVLKESLGRETDEIAAENLCISNRHFDYAFQHVLPSVSRRDQARYDRMRDRMARARSRGGVADATTSDSGVLPDESTSQTPGAAAEEPAT
jgi:ribosome biogenesis ATPase